MSDKWYPGMRGVVPGLTGFARHLDVIGRGTSPWHCYNQDGWNVDDLTPDESDPSTQGALLDQVRKRYGHGPDRDVSIERIAGGRYSLAVRVWHSDGAWVYDADVHGAWLAGCMARDPSTVTQLDRDTYGEALLAALGCDHHG